MLYGYLRDKKINTYLCLSWFYNELQKNAYPKYSYNTLLDYLHTVMYLSVIQKDSDHICWLILWKNKRTAYIKE